MLHSDDPLVVSRHAANEVVDPNCRELSRYDNMRPLGSCAFVGWGAVADSAVDARPDAHDVICLSMWAIVLLPDATVFPGRVARMHRTLGTASQRVLIRHNVHWKAAHRAPLLLPDAPI